METLLITDGLGRAKESVTSSGEKTFGERPKLPRYEQKTAQQAIALIQRDGEVMLSANGYRACAHLAHITALIFMNFENTPQRVRLYAKENRKEIPNVAKKEEIHKRKIIEYIFTLEENNVWD